MVLTDWAGDVTKNLKKSWTVELGRPGTADVRQAFGCQANDGSARLLRGFNFQKSRDTEQRDGAAASRWLSSEGDQGAAVRRESDDVLRFIETLQIKKLPAGSHTPEFDNAGFRTRGEGQTVH